MVKETKRKRAIICVDASNYHYYLKKKGWRIDYKSFVAYFRRLYDVQEIFFYEGILSQAAYFDIHPQNSRADFTTAITAKREFFGLLRRLSVRVRTKPVGRVYDNTEGCFKHKCNFDVELTVDALDNLSRLDIFVLCSGDGDFTRLIKYLKGKFKKTIVVAPSERLSDTLRQAANQVVYLEDIRADIAMPGNAEKK